MNSAKITRQIQSRKSIESGESRSSRRYRSEFSRHLWKTSALSTVALAGAGAAYAQDALWQPQVQTIIGGDHQGAYSSLEGFIPLTQTPDSVVFLDLRLKHDFSEGTGGDVGLGLRRVVNPDLILGGYAYLNVQRLDGHQFTGATLGIEAIATNFDAHVNVHLPFGDQERVTSSSSSSLSLVGNQLLEQISVLNRRDYASWGVEGEFGVQAPIDLPKDHALRLHVGGYHFEDAGNMADSVTGGKAGFEYKIGNVLGDSGASLTFGGEVRYDDRDDTTFAGFARLTIPLGETQRVADGDREPLYNVSEGLRKRANERVRGDIGVRLDTDEATTSLSRRAINARTGSEFGLFFFADGENTLGLGTLGDPTTLDDAVTKAGSGFVVALGGSGNLLTGGVTLVNGQTVIGGGQTVQALLFNGSTSSFALGGSDGTIQGSNPANPVLSLGNGNTLQGITVTGGGVGILGNNINGATLTGVTVDGSGSHGASFTGTSTGVNASNFSATDNGGDGLHIESDGTYNFTGTTLLSGNAVDGLSITGNGTYNFQTVNVLNNTDDGIEVTSATGTFKTSGGTISGNGDVGVKIDPIKADVVLTSITHSGGTSGVILDDVTGSFTVTGATTISNTSGAAIAISNSPASIRFADITITSPGADAITFAGINGPVVVGGVVISGLGAGATGLDFSGSRTTFTAQSVIITGTGAAGSIGIDLSGTQGGSAITITNGGTIANVDTGVRLGIAGSLVNTANASFSFGGGSVDGITASLDARGLNPLTGTYAFGSTVFNGPQLFSAANIVFVGSTATGAGDGSSVNDLATIGAADANAGADAIFVLVNDGSVIDDADGFTLGDGQTLASFGNGAEYALGGVPLNVTGDNVQNGVIQDDPTGNGAATLTNLGAGDTVVLGDGTVIANITISNGAGGVGIFGDNIDGATLTGVTVSGADFEGALFTGASTNVSGSNFTATGNGGSGLLIDSDGTFDFTGTTQLSNNADFGLSVFGDGVYAFDTLNTLNNGILGIEVISPGGGVFQTTGGIVSGNAVGGIAALGADLDSVLTSLSQDGGLFGATLAGVSGEFVMTGATTVANTSIGGLQIADSTANITFGSVDLTNVGLGGGIAIQRSTGVVTFGGPVSIDQSASVGIGIDGSTGPVIFAGPVDITRTFDYGIALGWFEGNSGAVTFGDVTIDQAFGGISVADTNGTVTFGNVDITGMDGGAGLDLASYTLPPPPPGGTTVFTTVTLTAASLDITGTNVAGSTGIDLSGTVGGSVTITNGGTIENVDTGVQLGTNGVGGVTANTDFVFGGGSIEGLTASLDMRGLNPGSGTYSFGATALIGPQLFDAVNVVFVGAADTGAGDGSSVNDLIDADDADALTTDANTIFVLVGTAPAQTVGTDADGFTLATGQSLVSFANGATVTLDGAPTNVTGDNVVTGSTQADPFGVGAPTLNNTLGGSTIDLANGNLVSNLVVASNVTAIDGTGGITGFNSSGVEIRNAATGLFLDNALGTITVNNLTIQGPVQSGIVLANTAATVNFTGTTTIAGGSNAALLANNFDGTASFADLDITGGAGVGIGILAGSSGTLTFGASSSIIDTGGVAFSVAASTANVTYNGNITQNTAASAVRVNAMTGGTVTFGGQITANTSTATAVSISNNTGGTFTFAGEVVAGTSTATAVTLDTNTGATTTFNGGLDIDTTTGIGLLAQNGGAINVAATAGAETINSAAGQAISLLNVAADVTLDSVASTGGGVGVNLQDVSGAFAVEGATTISSPGFVGMAIFNSSATVSFDDVTVTNSGNDSIRIGNNSGPISFLGTTTVTNPSGAASAVEISGTNGNISFADLDISLGTANTIGLNLSGAVVGAGTSISAGDFDVSGGGFAGTLGIDLSGTTGLGVVQLGDAVNNNPAGQTSTIANVANGVRFSAATNLGDALTGGFIFGDGAVPAESLIQTTGGLVLDGVLTTNGRYNFRDATLVGDTSNLTTALSLYYVDDVDDGINDGTRANPGTIADAMASGADAIVLVNNAGDADDTIDIFLQPGGVSTLDLDPNQHLYSFRQGDTLVLPGGAPANFLLTGITSGSITNPGMGTPTLTSTGGVNTVTLDDNNTISGVIVQHDFGGMAIDGAGGITDFNSSGMEIRGASIGLFLDGALGTVTIDDLNIQGPVATGIMLANTSATVNFTGTTIIAGPSSFALLANNFDGTASFADLDITGGGSGIAILNGSGGTLTFDAPSSVANTGDIAFSVGSSTANITYNGTITQNNAVSAVSLTGNTGGTVTFGGLIAASTGAANAIELTGNTGSTVNFNNGLAITTTSGTGFTATGGGAVDIAATGAAETISSSAGQAIELNGVTAAIALDSVVSSGGSRGIALNAVSGSFAVSGATTVSNAAVDGILIQNSSVNATFSGLVTVNNGVGADGNGVSLLTNTGTYAFNGGVDITVNGAGAFGLRAQTSGTVNIVDPVGVISQITSNNGTALLVNPTTVNMVLDSITSTNAAGPGVSLTGMGGSLSVGTVTVSGSTGAFGRGILIDGTGGPGTGTVSIDMVDINNVSDSGLLINGANGAITVSGGNIGGTNDPAGIGVDINSGSGDITINAAITKTTAGKIVQVSNRTAGAISFGGALSATGVFDNGIEANNNSGGTIDFAGTKTLDTGANAAVVLANNSGATVNFSGGGLNIDTTNGIGFGIIGGGVVNVSGASNTIDTSAGGTAVSIIGGGDAIDINAALTTGPGRVVDIQNRIGGAVTLSGAIANTAPGAQGIRLQANTGGTTQFSGTVDVAVAGAESALGITNGAAHVVTFSGANTMLSTAGTGPAVNITNGTVTFGGTNTALSSSTTGSVVGVTAGGTLAFTGAGTKTLTATGSGTGFSASAGGDVTVTGAAAISTATGAAVNMNGVTVNSGVAFASTSNGSGGTSGVVLTGVAGTGAINLGGGGLIGGSAAAILVEGGTAGLTYAGSLTSTTVSGSTGRGVDIQNRGAGAQTITLSGAVTHNVAAQAGIFINNNAGTITLSGPATISGGGGVVISNNAAASTVNVTGLLTVSGVSATALEISNSAGAVTFDDVTITNSGGDGIALTANSGTVSFNGTTSVTNPATAFAAVDIEGANGAITFADLEIVLGTAATTGLDLTGAAINANITANDFDVDGGGNAGTLGVDLSGTIGTGVIQLGDLNNSNPAGQTSRIVNVVNGLRFTAATNTNFVLGDGQAPAESEIASSGLALVGVLPGTGTYDFDDVNFGTSDVSNLSPVSLYYVDPEGNGDGSLTNPGSIGGAEGSTANVIVLIDPTADANTIIDMMLGAHQGVDANPNSLNLDDGQVLISFGSDSAATIDVADLGIGAGAGAPASFSFSTIQSSTVIDRPVGLTTRPTLTTSAAAGTVLLPTVSLGGRITSGIDGVLITNTGTGDGVLWGGNQLSTFVIRNNSIIASGNGALDLFTTAGSVADTLILSIDGNTLQGNVGTPGAAFGGQNLTATTSTLAIRSFANNVVNGGGGGIQFTNVHFDGDDAAGDQAVNGGMLTVGTTGTRVQGDGINFFGPIGTLNFTTLNIANNGGTGLLVDAKGPPATTFSLDNTGGTVDTTGGAAFNLDPLTVDMTFASITATGGANGIIFDQVAGTFTVTGATSITGTSGFGISAINTNTGTFNFNTVTIDNDAGGNGGGIGWASGTLSIAGLANIDTATNAGISQSGGTVSFSGGVTIDTTTGTGIVGTGGALNVANAGTRTVNSTGGTAISLNAVTANINLGSTSSGGGTNNVSITGGSGAVTLGAGSMSGATADSVSINGGTVDLTYSGNVTQAGAGALASFSNGHSGDVVFNTGTLNATNGIGLQFDNADGTYQFNGTTTLNGGDAGIDILNGSTGTFSFGANTAITHNAAGSAFNLSGATASNANVTYSGNITDNSGFAVNIDNHDAGTITFQTGSISANGASAQGISVANSSGGTVSFNGQTTLSTQGNTAVNLANNTGATINFSAAGNGLDITTSSGIGFSVTGGGTINVSGSGNSVATATGVAVNLSGVTIGVSGINFSSTNKGTAGGTSAVIMNTVNGGTVALGGGTLNGGGTGAVIRIGDGAFGTGGTAGLTYAGAIINTSGTGQAVSIQDRAAGAQAVTLSGSISHNIASVTGIFIDDNLAGTVTFSGSSKSITSGTASAASLTDNTGAAIDFTGGGLAITTTSGTGFNVTGVGPAATTGGTVTVQGTGNTITSTTGMALNVVNTTIGAADMTFQSISASGAASGIILNNTGTSGGLTVTGVGTTDDSGGIIQNTSGNAVVLTNTRFTNLSNFTIGDTTTTPNVANGPIDFTPSIAGFGISMTNADDTTLTNVTIAKTGNSGIDGTGVTNLTISNSEILRAGDDNSESGIAFNDFVGGTQNNVDGTVLIQNTIIDSYSENGIDIENFAGTLNLTLSGVTIGRNKFETGGPNPGTNSFGENGFLARADGNSNMNITVGGNSLFDAVDGNGIFIVSEGTGTVNAAITDTTVQNSDAFGIVLFGGTGDHTSIINSIFNFDIIGNGAGAASTVKVTGTNSTAISIQPNGNSSMNGTVSGVYVDGSNIGRGIEVLADDVSDTVVAIDNNRVLNTAFNGIFANNGDSGVLDIHIRNNNVSAPLDTAVPSGLAVHGIEVNPLAEGSTTTLNISGNTSAGNAASGGAGYRLRQRDPAVFRLERFVGNPTSTADVIAFLVAQNVAGTGSATVGTLGYVGVANGAALDPHTPPSPLMAGPDGVEAVGNDLWGDVLTGETLDNIIAAAIQRWAAIGLTDDQLAALNAVTFDISDLGGNYLGLADGNHVRLDDNGNGAGWYVDATPLDDEEFASRTGETQLLADGTQAPAGQYDLLTTIMHEFGHILGYDDTYAADQSSTLMYGWLTTGERRLPSVVYTLQAQYYSASIAE